MLWLFDTPGLFNTESVCVCVCFRLCVHVCVCFSLVLLWRWITSSEKCWVKFYVFLMVMAPHTYIYIYFCLFYILFHFFIDLCLHRKLCRMRFLCFVLPWEFQDQSSTMEQGTDDNLNLAHWSYTSFTFYVTPSLKKISFVNV